MTRRQILSILAAALLFSLMTAGCTKTVQVTSTSPVTVPTSVPAAAPRAAPPNVKIVDSAYQPAALTVTIGTVVTWKNVGNSNHTVTSDTNVFSSGQLTPGDTFQWTFDALGDYNYHCSTHPNQMFGTITVTASVPSSPSGTLPTSPVPVPQQTPGSGQGTTSTPY